MHVANTMSETAEVKLLPVRLPVNQQSRNISSFIFSLVILMKVEKQHIAVCGRSVEKRQYESN